MTKLLYTLLFAALFAGLNTARADTLTYGTYLSATHNIVTQALEPYFKTVKEQTGGDLEFRMFTDSTVVGGPDAIKGVRAGLVDMAFIIPAYDPALMPATATFSQLALFTTTSVAGTAATNEMVLLNCEQCQEEWKKLGIKPLSFYATAPYYLLCTKKVNDLATLEGKRIRGTGPWPEWIAAMGAIPVSLAGGETYSAMNRGTVDCTAGPMAWLNTYGLMDIVKYVMDLPVGAYRPLAFLDMKLSKWDGLSADERTAITSNLASVTASAGWSYKVETEDAVAKARKEGIQFVKPGDDVQPRYDEFLKTEQQRFLDVANKRGVKDPQKLLDRYLEVLDKWNHIAAGINSKEEFQKALQEHIFSKVKY